MSDMTKADLDNAGKSSTVPAGAPKPNPKDVSPATSATPGSSAGNVTSTTEGHPMAPTSVAVPLAKVEGAKRELAELENQEATKKTEIERDQKAADAATDALKNGTPVAAATPTPGGPVTTDGPAKIPAIKVTESQQDTQSHNLVNTPEAATPEDFAPTPDVHPGAADGRKATVIPPTASTAGEATQEELAALDHVSAQQRGVDELPKAEAKSDLQKAWKPAKGQHPKAGAPTTTPEMRGEVPWTSGPNKGKIKKVVQT